MIRKLKVLVAIVMAGLTLGTIGLPGRALAQGGGSPDEGLHVYKAANCVGCHKWFGGGGGGYGGSAASLRDTQLDREQIIKTIHCGRPGTGMPYFERDAYDTGACDGMKKSDLSADMMPPEPDHYLRASEIEAVADYVLAGMKGKGPPTLAECQAFFGATSRACNTYKNASQDTGNAASDAQK